MADLLQSHLTVFRSRGGSGQLAVDLFETGLFKAVSIEVEATDVTCHVGETYKGTVWREVEATAVEELDNGALE